MGPPIGRPHDMTDLALRYAERKHVLEHPSIPAPEATRPTIVLRHVNTVDNFLRFSRSKLAFRILEHFSATRTIKRLGHFLRFSLYNSVLTAFRLFINITVRP